MRKLSTFAWWGLVIIIVGTIVGMVFGTLFVSFWNIPALGWVLNVSSIVALVMAIITFFFIHSKLFMKITAIAGIIAGICGAIIPLIGGVLLWLGIKRK